MYMYAFSLGKFFKCCIISLNSGHLISPQIKGVPLYNQDTSLVAKLKGFLCIIRIPN